MKGEPDPKPPSPTAKSGIKEYWKKAYPEASHGVSQTVLPLIKGGKQKVQVYMTYVYNPVYSNPDGDLQASVLKDESLIPFFVAIDAYMGEGTALADMILPHATYLERWDPETTNSYTMVPFVSLRQPVVKPLGEAREIREILPDLARRIGGGMEKYFDYGTVEDYIKVAVAGNPGLDFEQLKKTGVWYDKSKKPAYKSYMKELTATDLQGSSVDEKGNIYKVVGTQQQVIGLMVDGKAYKGFPTGSHKKTARFEIFSEDLEKHGFPGLPSYVPIPEHQNLKPGELILTTFKVNVHTQSRTANCKWLSEIFHQNPLWVNPRTAAALGLEDGDQVVVRSPVGARKTRIRHTEGVHPQVVCFAMSAGHWEYGRIARAQRFDSRAAGKDVGVELYDPDTGFLWWDKHGNGWHLNPIIPVRPDPIGGNQAWMNTVVTVEKAR